MDVSTAYPTPIKTAVSTDKQKENLFLFQVLF